MRPLAPFRLCRSQGVLRVWRRRHPGVLGVFQGQDICTYGPEAVLRHLLQTGIQPLRVLVTSAGGDRQQINPPPPKCPRSPRCPCGRSGWAQRGSLLRFGPTSSISHVSGTWH